MIFMKKARELQLDFRGGGGARWWAGWILLALAVAFAVDLGVSWVGLRSEVAQKEETLAGLDRQMRSSPPRPARPASKEELLAARDTIQRIAMPWDRLFGALEAASSTIGADKVALLAIEPDAQAGTVLISGESRDYAAALDYLQQLRQAGALKAVHLVRHEAQNGPGQPVAFAISASWSP